MKERHSHQDVSARVDVCDPTAVQEEVFRLLACVHPQADFGVLERAFEDFGRLFGGRYPGYHACDTHYHDEQRTLDVVLAMARLLYGHESTVPASDRLGSRVCVVGLVAALFHDAGYIRSRKDTRHRRGAEYTKQHVTRSARFLSGWLARQGWLEEADVASRVVHFTGYEVALSQLRVTERKHWRLGCFVGTADLIAQMSARTYLERCRDYLYEEFVVGGVAVQTMPDGSTKVIYESAEDLLRKTPGFFETEVGRRLEVDFGGVVRFASVCFGGRNLYMEEARGNIRYLREVLDRGDFSMLRRSPSGCPERENVRANGPRTSCAGLDETPRASP